jgi:hypothetical protein
MALRQVATMLTSLLKLSGLWGAKVNLQGLVGLLPSYSGRS